MHTVYSPLMAPGAAYGGAGSTSGCLDATLLLFEVRADVVPRCRGTCIQGGVVVILHCTIREIVKKNVCCGKSTKSLGHLMSAFSLDCPSTAFTMFLFALGGQ